MIAWMYSFWVNRWEPAQCFLHGKKLFIQRCQTIVVRAENFNLFCSNCCWCALSSRLFRSGEIDNDSGEKESKSFLSFFLFLSRLSNLARMACARQRVGEGHFVVRIQLNAGCAADNIQTYPALRGSGICSSIRRKWFFLFASNLISFFVGRLRPIIMHEVTVKTYEHFTHTHTHITRLIIRNNVLMRFKRKICCVTVAAKLPQTAACAFA